jgi:hypothetical protein
MRAKVTRIASGIYDAQTAAGRYEIERYPDGSWLVFETLTYGREYCNDYSTKRAALASLPLDEAQREAEEACRQADRDMLDNAY